MYNFIANMPPENCSAWRSANEIQLAAMRHEQQRIQKMGKQTCQDMRDIQSGWSATFQPPVARFQF